jgi:hypothetical protein
MGAERVGALGITMTPKMYVMLTAADGCSLPGDGLRIVGPGRHATARALEALGMVRVARPPDCKARVHITEQGRRWRQKVAHVELLTVKPPRTPRRKHTPYNPNACPICAPIRCEVARRREQP